MRLAINSANKSQSKLKICVRLWPQHGTGSKLNLLTSQDTRVEMLRTLEFDHNSLVEAQHTLASVTADRDAFIQKWSADLSQDLVTARDNLDTAQASLDKAIEAP